MEGVVPNAGTNGMAPSEVHYFNSYNHHGIHEEMLKDEVRTKAYRDAIYGSKHLFKDKIVLDVGTGSGILSLFAAAAGAKHVIAVDFSSVVVMAREIAELNGYGDKITFLQGKMEEVVFPDGIEKVDIIISEWMGYFLLYESMMDTVLWARDRYLKQGGLIFPDKASMLIAGIEDREYKEDKIGFWDNVYGFNFAPFKAVALSEPLVDVVDMKAMVTDPACVITFDLNTVTVADLAFSKSFELAVRQDDHIHAFVAWFDIEFSVCHKPVKFSTGPHAKYTHWKQTVFYAKDEIAAEAGEKIVGELSCKPNGQNRRDLDIGLQYELNTNDEARAIGATCTFKMS